MNALEYFYDIECMENCSDSWDDTYDFWTVTPDNKFYFFRLKGSEYDLNLFLEAVCNIDLMADYSHFIDWEYVSSLMDIKFTEDSSFPTDDRYYAYNAVAIRGECGHNCKKRIKSWRDCGYGVLPACESVYAKCRNREHESIIIDNLCVSCDCKIGTIYNKEPVNFWCLLLDVIYWVYCCDSLNAGLFVFDSSSDCDEAELSFGIAAIMIHGKELHVVSKSADVIKLYKQYHNFPVARNFDEIVNHGGKLYLLH